MPTSRADSTRTLALLCVIYFMVILDAAIVRIAIPPMQHDLGLSPAAEIWVANSYMLTLGLLASIALRPAGGRSRAAQRAPATAFEPGAEHELA